MSGIGLKTPEIRRTRTWTRSLKATMISGMCDWIPDIWHTFSLGTLWPSRIRPRKKEKTKGREMFTLVLTGDAWPESKLSAAKTSSSSLTSWSWTSASFRCAMSSMNVMMTDNESSRQGFSRTPLSYCFVVIIIITGKQTNFGREKRTFRTVG